MGTIETGKRRGRYLIVGFVAVLFLIIGWAIKKQYNAFYWAHMDRGCASMLRTIANACQMYARDHDGTFPDSFHTLMLHTDIEPVVFWCPASDDSTASGATTQETADALLSGGHLSYVYTGRGLTLSEATADTVIAFDPLTRHRRGMNVVFGDGHVDFVDTATARKIEAQAAAARLPIVVPPR